MKRNLTACVLLGALAVAFTVAACGPANAPDTNSVEKDTPANAEPPGDDVAELHRRIDELEAELAAVRKKPEPEPGSNYTDWVEDNPLRNRMRDMWINCGLIIANSDAAEAPSLDWLLNPALQISETAAEIEDYWQRIRDANREEFELAKQGEWGAAHDKWDETHQGCRECHDKLWPKQARGMLPETVEGWVKNQRPFGSKWGDQVWSAPPTVKKGMQKLQTNMFSAEDGLLAEDLERTKAATLVIDKASEKNLEFWSGIRRNAEAIVEKARNGKTDVREEYENLTQYCIKCHETTSDNRGVNPLPWPQPGD